MVVQAWQDPAAADLPGKNKNQCFRGFQRIAKKSFFRTKKTAFMLVSVICITVYLVSLIIMRYRIKLLYKRLEAHNPLLRNFDDIKPLLTRLPFVPVINTLYVVALFINLAWQFCFDD